MNKNNQNPKLRLVQDPTTKMELNILVKKTVELTTKSPAKAALILSRWIKKPAQKTVFKKKTG